MLKRDYKHGSLVSIGKAQSLLLDLGPKLVTESRLQEGGRSRLSLSNWCRISRSSDFQVSAAEVRIASLRIWP